MEAIDEREQRDGHARRSDEQQRLAADLVDQADRHETGRDRHQTRHDIDLERLVFGKARQLPPGRAVIEDHVDADQLLEHRQQQPRPHDRTDAAAGRVPDVGQAGTMILVEARGNLAQLLLRRRRTEQPGQHDTGFVQSPLLHQKARAFGNEGQRDQEYGGRQRLHPVHPAPRLISAPPHRGRRTGGAGQIIVHDERGGQAGNDHDLLDGGHPPANIGGRHFGDIDRGQHRSRAYRHAAHEAGDDENDLEMAETLDDRTDQEQDRGQHHHLAPAHGVGQLAGKERADETTDQQRTNRQAQPVFGQVERGLEPFLGAVHRAAVISEQQPPDRRHRNDRDDKRDIHALPRRLYHPHPLRYSPFETAC